jgi:hypothetical protein
MGGVPVRFWSACAIWVVAHLRRAGIIGSADHRWYRANVVASPLIWAQPPATGVLCLRHGRDSDLRKRLVVCHCERFTNPGGSVKG